MIDEDALDRYLRQQSQMRDSPDYDASNDAVALDRERLSFLSPLDANVTTADDPAHNVFLFVNPTSGGNQAAAFMEAGLEYIRLTCPEPVNLWIWDIRQGSTGKKPGFIKLKTVTDNLQVVQGGRRTGTSTAAGAAESKHTVKQRELVYACPDDVVYVVVCGGDGTVMWAVTEMWAHRIADSKVALGVVPYGTGNDFARALGWQKFNAAQPYNNRFKILKELIREWLRAVIVFHDIWDVTLKVQNDGAFMKIDSVSRKKKAVAGVRPVIDERELSKSISTFVEEQGPGILCNMSARVLTLRMCNYFSMGIESRIGVGFDRYRTTSQFWNKLRYGVEGGKKAVFKGISPLNTVVTKLIEQDEAGQTKILFENDGDDNVALRKNTRSIIASNIPSFAAGLDLWGPSTNSGIQKGKKPVKDQEILRHQQVMGDGQLEFVAFSTVAQMGIERAFHGQGKRVAAGSGPFTFEFNPLKEERSYFQVDGEFFIMTKPERVTIKHRRKIKVLCQADLANQKNDSFCRCG